jgi:hypothetical protein
MFQVACFILKRKLKLATTKLFGIFTQPLELTASPLAGKAVFH